MNFKKYIIIAVLGLTAISCGDDFLNPLPDSAIVLDSFFETDEDVLAGIYGIYDAVQGVNEHVESNESRSNRGIQFEYMLTEMRSDNTKSQTFEGSKADFHRYRVVPDNNESEDYYQSMYEIIFRANNILDFIEVADAKNQATYTAEAKFLRAYAYFNLVRLYGDVPLATAVVNPTEEEILFTRVPTEQIYTQIVADLEEAILSLDNSSRSRASKGAAQGILAKVYMTQASPNYARAQELCEAIVNSGDYDLMENYADIYTNELNSEIIFAVEYQFENALESQSYSSEFTSAFRQGREDGLNLIDNPSLIEDLTAAGGVRGEASYVTFGTRHEPIKFLPQGSDLTQSPPSYGKNPQFAGNDWIVLRYADILLLHAEAIMAGGITTTDGAAIDSYMAVRARAGFDPVADRPTTLSKDALLLERRVELAWENHRFFDLVRFGVADAVLTEHANTMGYSNYDARKLLLPIPAREINLSRGVMLQNPGY